MRTREIFKNHFSEKYVIHYEHDLKNAIREHQNKMIDFIFIDLKFFKEELLFTINKQSFDKVYLPLNETFRNSKKVIISKLNCQQDCIQALKYGIDSYINYPIMAQEIREILKFNYTSESSNMNITSYTGAINLNQNNSKLKTNSKVMSDIYDQVKTLAKTSSTVLITGESGTGKSYLAKNIHLLSKRKHKPFISVHCSALAENLIESELFGHEKGAFTGAIRKKTGKFELADGGTLFLDEIGTLSKSTQVRLLQVLQERIIEKVGSEKPIPIDIRIIAATNSDLSELVRKKYFREDLYYRLNVMRIELPPLRQRCEDIDILSSNILDKLNKTYHKNILYIDQNVETALRKYTWPGNIRELENLIERAYVLEKSKKITDLNLPDYIETNIFIAKKTDIVFKSLNLSEARKEALNLFEKKYMKELLKKTNGQLKEASIIAGVSVRQLHKFISKHHINRKDFSKQRILI